MLGTHNCCCGTPDECDVCSLGLDAGTSPSLYEATVEVSGYSSSTCVDLSGDTASIMNRTWTPTYFAIFDPVCEETGRGTVTTGCPVYREQFDGSDGHQVWVYVGPVCGDVSACDGTGEVGCVGGPFNCYVVIKWVYRTGTFPLFSTWATLNDYTWNGSAWENVCQLDCHGTCSDITYGTMDSISFGIA